MLQYRRLFAPTIFRCRCASGGPAPDCRPDDPMYTKLPRLHYDRKLESGRNVVFEKEDLHYLINVMRLQVGNLLRIFNEADGEYLCRLDEVQDKKRSDKRATFRVLGLKRAPISKNAIHTTLLFAPIKKPRMKNMVEKATELNTSSFIPLITQHTNIAMDTSSLQISIIQAAEQCERMSMPTLYPPIRMNDLIEEDGYLVHKSGSETVSRCYLVCSARSDSEESTVLSLHDALAKIQRDSNLSVLPLAVVVGPEGGFAENEMAQFSNKTNVHFVTLGRNVLRSETAATVALGYLHLLLKTPES